MHAHTEILEASVFLARDEAMHEFTVIDHDATCLDERRIVAVAVDNDRRRRTVE